MATAALPIRTGKEDGGDGGDANAPTLAALCLQALADAPLGADVWALQRRTLEALPPDLANELLRRLLGRGAFAGAGRVHLLERFAACATEVALPGAQIAAAPHQAVAHVSSFRHLIALRLDGAKCVKKAAQLEPLRRLAPTLRSLSLRGARAGHRDAARVAETLRALSNLRELDLSNSGFGAAARAGHFSIADHLLPGLSGLTSLRLGGLGLSDAAAAGVERMAALRDLDLSWSEITADFLEGAIGRLTMLTALDLSHSAAGALPLFGCLEALDVSGARMEGVAHSVHSGEMRLRRLACRAASFGGIAALALREVLRASAPTLEALEAGECVDADAGGGGGGMGGGGGGRGQRGGQLWLLPLLSGCTQLARLDLATTHPGLGAAAPARDASPLPPSPPPLAALGLTRVQDLDLGGCRLPAMQQAALLEGLTSLTRLELNQALPGGGGGLDDAALAALAARPMPLLRHLGLANTRVRGLFDGGSGGGGGVEGRAPAASAAGELQAAVGDPWASFPALRSLNLDGAPFCRRVALERLASAVGGRLQSLAIGGAPPGPEGRAVGGGLTPAMLALLCDGLPGLRELDIFGGECAPATYERHLPRLPRLRRARLRRQPWLQFPGAEALAPLAARLAPRCEVWFSQQTGEAAERLERVAAAAVAGVEEASAPAGAAAGAAAAGPVAGLGAARLLDQRTRYSAARIEALRPPAAAAPGGADGGGGSSGGGVEAAQASSASDCLLREAVTAAGCAAVLRSDW